MRLLLSLAALVFTLPGIPQPVPPDVLRANVFNAKGTYALVNVSVIDGTGTAARQNQTVVIAAGLIQYAGDAAGATIPEDAEMLDLPGRTVIPGLIMMHEHLHDFENGPRLFLANGVTTVRTAGAFRPFDEVNLREWIREGRVPGPELFLASPFVSEKYERLHRYPFIALRNVENEEHARRFVRYWASEGFNAIKVYRGITPGMLRVVTDEAHKHGLHVLGHLEASRTSCLQAFDAGIDTVEHTLRGCMADLREGESKRIDMDNPQVRERVMDLAKR